MRSADFLLHDAELNIESCKHSIWHTRLVDMTLCQSANERWIPSTGQQLGSTSVHCSVHYSVELSLNHRISLFGKLWGIL